VNTIALTGHPVAQEAVALQLQALLNGRVLAAGITVRAGVTQSAEAHGIHLEGGEIWHCGTADERGQWLGGLVDRTLPADTFEAIGALVVRSLNAFQAKTRIAA
jgi:hypothetical protein